ncbi:MAG: T9SS type A sorting domain-containing protein [Bacteroidetes bacterium]|nr:T9SS type A sorting domain-containing protein [Bacteroidota bacterium]
MKRLLLSFASVLLAVFVMAQYNVTFNVDVSGIAGFDPLTTEVYMAGDFLGGWEQPGTNPDYKMTANGMIYTLVWEMADGENILHYKYFLIYDGTASWDNGEWTGDPNREAVVKGEITFDQVFGDKPFGVVFTVDMSNATVFDPATDKVYMAGNFTNYAGDWNQPGTLAFLMMEPIIGNEMFYTKSLVLNAKEYMYKYFRVINDEPSWDNGEWTGDPNRTVIVDTAMSVDNLWNSLANINEFDGEVLEAVYPNPCQSYINIGLNGQAGIEKIQVINSLGAVVRSIPGVPFLKELRIETGDLNNGVYFITVHSGNGVQTARFIKE